MFSKAGYRWQFGLTGSRAMDSICNVLPRKDIVGNMHGVTSLASGRDEFDPKTIYATSTRQGGGAIFKVHAGV